MEPPINHVYKAPTQKYICGAMLTVEILRHHYSVQVSDASAELIQSGDADLQPTQCYMYILYMLFISYGLLINVHIALTQKCICGTMLTVVIL